MPPETRAHDAARAILEERARQLAQRETEHATETIEVISFQLAGETYALPADAIINVTALGDLTPLPSSREAVIGITEWRGELLTVLDLRRILGLPATSLDDLRMLIVLGRGRGEFALLADAMDGLASLDLSKLHVTTQGRAASSEHVRGLTDDAVILLDADSLMRAWRARR